MAKFCRLSPVVFVKNGQKTEEKDSQLFKDLMATVKDRETAWRVWAYTQTDAFKEKYGDQVEYDNLGEVTILSLVKAWDLEEDYNRQKGADEAARDYGFTNAVFENAGTAVDKINGFNSKEARFIASIQKRDTSYEISVEPRNARSIEEARKQSYNHALTGEILNLMSNIGFGVNWVSNPKYNGLFDPQNATLYEGLLQIINLAEGERGELALPEEFSHMMIEGLGSHPLVQRLMNTLDETAVKEILGNKYDKYSEAYNGDGLQLKKEAAGKLLAQYITGKGTISKPVVEQKKSLLSRIWSWVKNLFSKITKEDLAQARLRADETVAEIYNLIASGEAVDVIDKHNVLDAKRLYQLQEEYDTLEKIAIKGETVTAGLRKDNISKGKMEKGKKLTKSLETLQKKNESNNYFESVELFLKTTKEQIDAIAKDIQRVKRVMESGRYTDIQTIGSIAKVATEVNTFIAGYHDILSVIATLDEPENFDKLGLSEEAGTTLADTSAACMRLLNDMAVWRQSVTTNILYNASRTVYKEDKVRGIGSKRNEVMALTEILDHANRDISFVDRWLSAMSDADDSLLTIFDSIVKNQQYERDMEMIDWNAQIAAADDKLRKAGYSSEFMFERDSDGIPTNRIISAYDWETYNKELKARIAILRERQETEDHSKAWYSKQLMQWKMGTAQNHQPRLIKVYVDPEVDAAYRKEGEKAVPDDAIFEMVPNPKVYTRYANRIDNLAPAQKEYYDTVMKIKRTMMTKIPHRGQGIYKAIFISKDWVEGIIANSTSNPLKATLENFKKKFVRRPDDIGFGTGENYQEDIQHILITEKDSYQAAEQIIQYLADALDEDIIAILNPKKLKKVIDKNRADIKQLTEAVLESIASENFIQVDTDFAHHRIQKLPIYYTRPLRDKKMLSTDFSGSLVAYSAMSVNYEKMNAVVDILELGRNYVHERAVREAEGGKSMMSRYTALGKVYKAYVERSGNGTNIAGRMDDFMDSVVYEQRKNDENTFEVFGVNLDTAKTLDALKDYTGLLALGFNIFSSLSNVGMGKLQMWIEAAGGEYFSVKDYAKAILQYNQHIGPCVAEMASPVKRNKLSLLIQMFDPMGDYYESLRNANYQKSKIARILGNGMLAYIGMNAGEHLLHCLTMLSILNHLKLTNTQTGDKISLYDALEVKDVGGTPKLVLKENLSYKRDLIDNEGTPKTNKHYGRPFLDENGRIKTEQVPLKDLQDNTTRQYLMHQKKKVRKVNDSLHGAFSANDKGAFHKKAVGRLIMQFRQWMPAHYMRRFARAHYDSDLEQWREGYYTTVAKTLNSMLKEYKRAGWETAKMWGSLSDHEKANLRRAVTELSQFWMLMFLIRLGGRVKDRDRSWLDKMALYQTHRMYLEVGGSMPANGAFFSNIFQILQSPAASIDTFERFSKVLQIWNIFDEIQTGRYQGWSEWQRDVYQNIPALGQITKAIDFDDSMFSMFEQD